MRELDRRAMCDGGMPGVVLMENAGRAVFHWMAHHWAPLKGRRATVWCGPGNNGGDGFVAARFLHLAGADVRVVLCADPLKVAGDARIHFDIMLRCGITPVHDPWPDGIHVDALLGTGLTEAPKAALEQAILRLNSLRARVVSVDIPSGVDGATGRVPGAAVCAEATVTFGFPKIGMLLYPGRSHVGAVHVDPIGFDWRSLHPPAEYRQTVPSDFAAALRRNATAHKGTYGHVVVVGGSTPYSGAPALAGLGALRTGAGLVTVVVPAGIRSTVAGFAPEMMVMGVGEAEGQHTPRGLTEAGEVLGRASSVCLGPGLGSEASARSGALGLLAACPLPMVVDADALNALAQSPDTELGSSAGRVLTPHPGEAARLLGSSTEEVEADRPGAVRRLAASFRCVVVLKGASTLVCDGRQQSTPLSVSVITTGNPGMATGGCGDVLAGCIAALLGRGWDAAAAAEAGAWLHGRAGDLARDAQGENGMTAGDVAHMLPLALRETEVAG
jgi:NAD(P)H-hydrate epimerase